MRSARWIAGATLACLLASPALADVRVKDLGRFLGWRDNPLVGYGVVTGLAGSGDSPRNPVTRQALQNVLGRLGANIPADQVQSRNVAAVIVTATLPPSANVGDRIDVTVSSIGDARSLVGGALLMTPLLGPNQQPYALAQGAVVVGGYRFDGNLNLQQKNYPTSAVVPDGATVEAAVRSQLQGASGELSFILDDPDVTTAERVAEGINIALAAPVAVVDGPDRVVIRPPPAARGLYRTIAQIENVRVDPDGLARVVVNERAGTVVAGSGVQISSVVISQGDIKVSVSVDNQASQPFYYSGIGGDVRSLVVTNTKLDVTTAGPDAIARFPNTTVGDLVAGLRRVNVDTRGIITILQSLKTAGALHAQLIVQ